MTKKDSVKIISDAIREGRMRRGWSQKDLAAFMNVHTTLVSKWEHCKAVPTGDGLFQLAIELDLVPLLFSDYFAEHSSTDCPELRREIVRLKRENVEIKTRLSNLEKVFVR